MSIPKRNFMSYMYRVCLCFLVLVSCDEKSIPHEVQLTYLDQYEVPAHWQVDTTVFGGISGVDYDSISNVFYAISDDRKDPRWYTFEMEVKEKRIETLRFQKTIQLRDVQHQLLQDEYSDFESIRFHYKQDILVLGDEGGKNGSPKLRMVTKAGVCVKNIRIDSSYTTAIRKNKAFESVCFSKDATSIFYATEAPLLYDGTVPTEHTTGRLRIIQQHLVNKEIMAQWYYTLAPIPQCAAITPPWGGAGSDNGLSELIHLGKDRFLTLERSGAYQREGTFSYRCKVFLVTPEAKTKAMKKEVVIDFSELPDGNHNIEGMTLGPIINGKPSLLLVSDNNFSKTIPTKLYLFTITY